MKIHKLAIPPDKKVPLRGVKISDVTKVSEARRLYETYTKNDDVWDLWRFKKAFIDVYKYPIRFITAKYKRKIVGVLPLWYDETQKHYEYVSGWWAEKGRPFCKDIRVIKKMLSTVKENVTLDAMMPETAKIFGKMAKRDHDHFALDLTKVGGTWEGYLASLKAKKRQNINYDVRRVQKRRYSVRYNRFSDLKHLFRLNILRMDHKSKVYSDEEKSVFETDKLQQKVFQRLWKKATRDYKARIITTLVGKKVVSVDFNLIYKKKYYTLLGGQDVNYVPGIGAFANMLDIEDAIAHGCNYVDFCMEDHHWKSSWFVGTPRYKVVVKRRKRRMVTKPVVKKVASRDTSKFRYAEI